MLLFYWRGATGVKKNTLLFGAPWSLSRPNPLNQRRPVGSTLAGRKSLNQEFGFEGDKLNGGALQVGRKTCVLGMWRCGTKNLPDAQNHKDV